MLIDTSKVKIVNAGPDTLQVNYKFADEQGVPTGETLPEHVGEQLDDWQKEARKEHTPQTTTLVFSYLVEKELVQQSLSMRPHGSGIWSWLLFCDDIKLSLSYGTMNGAVFCQVRFSSHLLHTIGAASALVAVESMLHDFLGACFHNQTSELHLCADIVGWDVSHIDWQHAFVSRVVCIRERPELPTEEEQEGGMSPKQAEALEKQIQEQIREGMHLPFPTTMHRKIATLDFGSHGSAISAQIYNKSREIKVHHKEWFLPIWEANGYHPETDGDVWRVEVRVKRKWLADFELNESFDVLASLEQIWRYATEQWLRYVDLSVETSNISRRPTHPVWTVLQNAYASSAEPAFLAPETAEERLAQLIEVKPLQVIQEAASMSLEEHQEQELLQMTPEEETMLVQEMPTPPATRVDLSVRLLPFLVWSDKRRAFEQFINRSAIQRDLGELPVDLLQAEARDMCAELSAEQRSVVLDRLWWLSEREVRTVLVRRTRRISKQTNCIAAGIGYMRSAVALAGEELASPLPNILSSLVWFYGKAVEYDRKRKRVHLDEVLKKQVSYGLITAQQLEEERALHGVELQDADWGALQDHLEALQGKPYHRSSASYSDVV